MIQSIIGMNNAAFLFINMGAFELQLLAVALLMAIAYVIGLVHCVGNDHLPSSNRVLWCLAILSLPVIGTIAYWFVGRKQTKMG